MNESAENSQFCLYIDEFVGGDAERYAVDDKFYSTQEDAKADIFRVMAGYLKEFEDIDPENVDYIEHEDDGTVEFFCDNCPKRWVVGVTVANNESLEETSTEENVNETADDAENGEDFDARLKQADDAWEMLEYKLGAQNMLFQIQNMFNIEWKEQVIAWLVKDNQDIQWLFKKDDVTGRFIVDDGSDAQSDSDDDSENGGDQTIDDDLHESVEPKAEVEENDANESVSMRFAKHRSMFESLNEGDDSDDDTSDNGGDSEGDNGGDGESNDGGSSDDVDDKDNDDTEDKDKKDDEEETEEMKAVVLTVKKEDAEKLKEQLIDAGCDEEDIEIIEGEEEDENSKVRVDVNSVMELKAYLDDKGIDLEKEIGGEIVSDEDGDDNSDDSGNGDENSDDTENKENDDDTDFNFDDLGDIMGADDSEDEK